jgi:hypothetical protein
MPLYINFLPFSIFIFLYYVYLQKESLLSFLSSAEIRKKQRIAVNFHQQALRISQKNYKSRNPFEIFGLRLFLTVLVSKISL